MARAIVTFLAFQGPQLLCRTSTDSLFLHSLRISCNSHLADPHMELKNGTTKARTRNRNTHSKSHHARVGMLHNRSLQALYSTAIRLPNRQSLRLLRDIAYNAGIRKSPFTLTLRTSISTLHTACHATLISFYTAFMRSHMPHAVNP